MAEKVKKKGKSLIVLAVLLFIISIPGFYIASIGFEAKRETMEKFEKYGVVNLSGDFVDSEDEIDDYYSMANGCMIYGIVCVALGGVCIADFVIKNKKE